MADNAYDVIVIGAGPGGYVAAIRAAHQLAIRVRAPHVARTCAVEPRPVNERPNQMSDFVQRTYLIGAPHVARLVRRT